MLSIKAITTIIYRHNHYLTLNGAHRAAQYLVTNASETLLNKETLVTLSMYFKVVSPTDIINLYLPWLEAEGMDTRPNNPYTDIDRFYTAIHWYEHEHRNGEAYKERMLFTDETGRVKVLYYTCPIPLLSD